VLLKKLIFYSLERFVPIWLAPNVITTLGLLSVVTANWLLYAFEDESGGAPGWVYFFIGICIFMYQTLDNLDGKQGIIFH
jgi:hypothetical protein